MTLNVGDKIRILKEGHNMARVFAGDVLEVVEVDDQVFETEAPRLTHTTGTWMFDFDSEFIGWEKVEGE